MAGESTTVARPYAEAVFQRAEETDRLDLWSDMLALLSAVAQEAEVAATIANPEVPREQLQTLLLDIGSGRLSEEGDNLVKILVHNGRLSVLPEIRDLYERLKSERQGRVRVHIRSAYAVNAVQAKTLAQALTRHLGQEVEITTEKDPSLIGGVVIRAGDLVIDGSVQGRLKQLASELGI